MAIENDEERLAPVGGAEPKNQTPSSEESKLDESSDDLGDARLSPDSEDSEEGGQADADEREARRLEKRQRKLRQREAMARDRRERELLAAQNAQLLARLEAIESRQVASSVNSVDASMQRAEQAYQHAEAAIAKAVETNDGEALLRAMRVRDEARDAYRLAALEKQRIAQSAQQQRQQPAEARQPAPQAAEPPDPDMVREYRKFQARNPWYDPNGRDPDSQKAIIIDEALSNEGYDPRTPEYWSMLESRLKRAVPHHYDDADDGDDDDMASSPPPRRTPPVAGTRRANGGAVRDQGLSRERLAAIREAAGGDEQKFKRLVAYAKQYDRKTSSNSSAR